MIRTQPQAKRAIYEYYIHTCTYMYIVCMYVQLYLKNRTGHMNAHVIRCISLFTNSTISKKKKERKKNNNNCNCSAAKGCLSGNENNK